MNEQLPPTPLLADMVLVEPHSGETSAVGIYDDRSFTIESQNRRFILVRIGRGKYALKVIDDANHCGALLAFVERIAVGARYLYIARCGELCATASGRNADIKAAALLLAQRREYIHVAS